MRLAVHSWPFFPSFIYLFISFFFWSFSVCLLCFIPINGMLTLGIGLPIIIWRTWWALKVDNSFVLFFHWIDGVWPMANEHWTVCEVRLLLLLLFSVFVKFFTKAFDVSWFDKSSLYWHFVCWTPNMRLFKFNAILKTIANFNVEYRCRCHFHCHRCRITEYVYNKLLVYKLWFYGHIRFLMLFAVVYQMNS